METNKAERLEQAVAALDDLIALTRRFALHDSAQFLAMARLNLLIDVNGITDREFRSFCVALEHEAERRKGRVPPLPRSARRRRTEPTQSEETSLGKTWRGAELTSRHASRTGVKR